MLISLGSACRVREAIQRHLNVDTLETNMFDWVLSNFAAVVYFIQHIDQSIIESDFYDTNISFLDKRLVNHTKIRLHILIPPTNCKSAKEELHKTYKYTSTKIDKLASVNTRIHYVEQNDNLYTNQFSCTHWNWDKIFQDIDK